MMQDDIIKLINAFEESTPKPAENQSNSLSSTTNVTTNLEASKEPIRKSRIYLKNVDCLREPNRQPMEQTDNQLTYNTSHSMETSKPSNPPKQKISIKSVDVLREPALLRRDYEIQNTNINNFINFNTDLLNNSMDLLSSPMNLNASNTYDFSQNLNNSLNKSNLNNNDCTLGNSNNANVTMEVTEKPRRPKIYVKSVESFNLMPLDSLHTTNNSSSGYLNDHNTSCNNAQVYDSNVVHLPYMFDSNSTSNNLSNTANFISNQNDMDTFQFINTSNANNNYILENSLFLGSSDEININGEQTENITLIPHTTTPTPPATAEINTNMVTLLCII